MILTCPRCATRYEVDETDIRQEGRLVRCSACDEQWRAFPDGRESAAQPTEADAPVLETVEAEPAALADRPDELEAADASPPLRFRPLEGEPAVAAHDASEERGLTLHEPPAERPTPSADAPFVAPVRTAAPRRRSRAGLAWALGLLVLVIIAAAALVAWREQVMRASPAAVGAYSAIGLGPAAGRHHTAPHG